MSNSESSVQIPTPCYFMLIDILGFSRVISNLSGEQLLQRMQDWVDLVDTTAVEVGVEETQILSDTLFVREEDSSDGLKRLLTFARLLLERGLSNGFPLRGSIVRGNAAFGKLTYGDAVIKAHEIERSLGWVGIACEPGLPEIDGLWNWDVVVCFPIPRKAGKVKTMPAVAWNVPDTNVIIHEAGKGGLMKDREHMLWETAAKWERTAQFGNYLKAGKSDGLDPGRWNGGWLPGQ